MPLKTDSQKQVQGADIKPLYGVLGEVDPIVQSKQVAYGRSPSSDAAAAEAAPGGGLLHQAAEAAKEKLHDYAVQAVQAALGGASAGAAAAAAPLPRESSGPTAASGGGGVGVNQAIDEAAKKAQEGVKNLAAHAAEAALDSRLAAAVPPEMRGPARLALNALGAQVASRMSSAIADAAETAHKQVNGAEAGNTPAVHASAGHAIDKAAKMTKPDMKNFATQAADAVLASRFAQALPPEMRGPARMALIALGAQVAERIYAMITEAAEKAHAQGGGDANADQTASKSEAQPAGAGDAIDAAAKKAQAGVKEMAAQATEAALGSRLAEVLPPEMRGSARMALNALGSQVASRVSSAIADAAETAHEQVGGLADANQPAPAQSLNVDKAIDEAAKKAQAGVKDMASHAVESALASRLAEAVPPEMRGPAKMALGALGAQVAERVGSAISNAAEAAHKQVDGANMGNAPPQAQSGVDDAIDAAAKKAQAGVKEMAAQATDAALASRLAEAVPAEMRGPARMALNALGSQVAGRVSSAIADAAETAHKQVNHGAANAAENAPEEAQTLDVDKAIDEAAKKAQAGVKAMASQAADAALGSRFAQAVPPEMRGPAKLALNALGSQVAERISSAITDAAESAHKQVNGAPADAAQ